MCGKREPSREQGFSLAKVTTQKRAAHVVSWAQRSGCASTCCRAFRCAFWQRDRNARRHARDGHVLDERGGQPSRVGRTHGAWPLRCDDGLREYGARLHACDALLLLWT
jgi:hypothetical protein